MTEDFALWETQLAPRSFSRGAAATRRFVVAGLVGLGQCYVPVPVQIPSRSPDLLGHLGRGYGAGTRGVDVGGELDDP